MKTNLGLTFLFLLINSGAWSQDADFGIKAGINLANINVKDAEGTYDSRTGYHAGIF